MKKHIMFMVGSLALGIMQLHGMEQQPVLDKQQQKKFRKQLAGYRGAYLLQQVYILTDGHENVAEARLRKNYEESLKTWRQQHGNDPFVVEHCNKLEKFKTKQLPDILLKLTDVINDL